MSSPILLIPLHMRESVARWVEEGHPNPALMGSFLRAVLSNQLVEAFAAADEENRAAMHGWAILLYNALPGAAWGSREKLDAWYQSHRDKKE